MNIKQLFKNADIKLVTGYTAAGVDGAFVDGTEVDTLGYDSVVFITSLGAIAANGVFTARLKQSGTTATYGAGTIDRIGADLANSADTDDNKFIISEVFKPTERYMNHQYQRTVGNVTINNVIAILFNSHDNPPALAAVEASQFLNSPTPSTT